jgi:F-type H+-transporting ATPase subunit epsilon
MTLQVDVLAPAKIVTKVKAKQVQLPGIVGEMGILPGHTAFVSELGIGGMTISNGEKDNEHFFVAGGYVEVENDTVRILVDVCERAADIDRARAEAAKARASERLAQAQDAAVDYQRAQSALLRAIERLLLIARH